MHRADDNLTSLIRLEQVSKRYPNGRYALRDLDLEIGAGELAVLLGPSGCGKTTTLRLINRLIDPTSGRVLLDGVDVATRDPVELRRGVGYVIQQVGLFPHLTIADNVGTVPKLLGWRKEQVRDRADELLRLVGLDPDAFRDRYPHELSGGQQQRVGVARALGADPPVLLMDEPFGALDPVTRARLQDELLAIQADVRKTIVFVTHDLDEAVKLGDRIALFAEHGTLAQLAPPEELLSRPASEYVEAFVGADRGLKLLAVTAIPRDALVPPTEGDVAPDRPRIAADASLKDALALMAVSSVDRVVVYEPDAAVPSSRDDGDDQEQCAGERRATRILGVLTADAVARATSR
jgi:osmoprotectant transport system ATP-binding protein